MTLQVRLAQAVPLICLLGAGCQEYKVGKLTDGYGPQPRIEVTPSALDFGGLSRGETGVQSVTISSIGEASLELGQFELSAPGAFTIVSAPEYALLEPGESAVLDVSYTPANTQDSGEVHIFSNDPSTPEAIVHLSGVGLIPLLQFDPPALDVGYTEPGTEITAAIDIVNGGGADLEVSLVAALGESFSAEEVPDLLLEPGERFPVEITFAPLFEQSYAGELWAESNTPAGSTKAVLTGTALEKPVAICEATPTEPFALYDTVTFIGSNSYVPGGGEVVGWEWALISRPDGSAVSMPYDGGGADRTGLIPDMVGEYTAQLVVTSDEGEQSDPCTVSFTAIPSQNLWVEMYWELPQDDMDLHLLAPGGSLTSGTDCYYANCVGRGLEWGVSGSDDNPSLDIDDIPGTGPENINIKEPEDTTYTVYVHDYMGSTPDVYDPNTVTVNIYLSGELVWTGMKAISGDNDYVPFAIIDVPSQSVSSL
jgi:hypothetical protein